MAKAGLFEGPSGYKMVPNAKYMRLSAQQSQFSVSTVTSPTSATLVAQSPRAFTPSRSSFAPSHEPSRTSYYPSSSYAASVKSFNPYDELSDIHEEAPLAGSSSVAQPYVAIENGYGG